VLFAAAAVYDRRCSHAHLAMFVNLLRSSLPVSVAALFFLVAACAQTTPTITLSTDRIQVRGFVAMRGTGFSPTKEAISHLRRPDGTEFPILPILIDDRGEFSHEIDTLLLNIGQHELWVVDSATGVSSNVARFEVIRD
jgi:hypothetical protein